MDEPQCKAEIREVNRMNVHVTEPEPYVSMFASELRLITGVTAAWGDVETGGDLYGFQKRAGSNRLP